MSSTPGYREFLTPRPIAGYRVVATAFLMAVYAWGLGFYGLSVYVQFLGGPHGWSQTLLSAATRPPRQPQQPEKATPDAGSDQTLERDPGNIDPEHMGQRVDEQQRVDPTKR